MVATYTETRPAPLPKRPYRTLPDGWDTGWKAAKAAAATTPAWMTGIGDSFMHGAYATDWHLTGWFGQLKTKFSAAGYGTHADFWPISSNLVRNPSMTGTIPFVITSTGISWAQNGFGELPIWTGAGVGSITFTAPYACTALDLVYVDSSQGVGTWTYTVDGGAPVTVTTVGSNTVKRIQLTGLANSAHTIVCASQSGNFVLQFCGVSTYAGTTGVGYGRLAYSGATTVAGIGQTGFKPSDKPAAYAGLAASAVFAGFPLAPHLAIVALGINDNTAGIGLDAYRQTLRRLSQALRRGRPDVSIMFVINSVANGVTSDQTSNFFGNPTQWPLYQQVQRQVAAEFNAAVVDFQAKWGETAVASGFTALAQGHPAQAGHDDMATTIYAVL